MMEQMQKDFMAMLRRCEGLILKVCLMYTDRQPASVADLYQDIVYNVWRSYGRFHRLSSESTWVYQIALRVAMKQRRHNAAAKRLVPPPDVVVHHTLLANNNELVDRLYELIDRLAPDEKALSLLYLDGTTVREMARITRMSKSGVKKKMKRIKENLKKMNEDER